MRHLKIWIVDERVTFVQQMIGDQCLVVDRKYEGRLTAFSVKEDSLSKIILFLLENNIVVTVEKFI